MTFVGYGNGVWDRPSGVSPATAAEAYRRRRAARQARNAACGGYHLPPFNEVFSTDNLMTTFDRLSREGGQAPGLDGLTYSALSRRDAAGLLRAVARSVRSGDYRPQPTRLVPIPKRSGGERKLQIASIHDRVVARQLYGAVAPLCETFFAQNSYGFRPGRGTWHLLAAQEAAIYARSAQVVTDDDVERAFDRVKPDAVLSDFARVIADPQYLALIGAVLLGSEGSNRKEGIDQGSPFSPLALNVHLHYAHDVLIDAEGNLPFWFRYVDNAVYLTQKVSEGRWALERAAELLTQVGLTLKGPGTPIDLQKGDSAKLLGFRLRLHGGTVRYEIPGDALTALETNLEEAHQTDDPPETARQAALGWVSSYGPALESSKDGVEGRVLSLMARQGFRGLLSKGDIRTRWRGAHQTWLTLRGRMFRGVKRR
jgi:retron-type reverse transcriptase